MIFWRFASSHSKLVPMYVFVDTSQGVALAAAVAAAEAALEVGADPAGLRRGGKRAVDADMAAGGIDLDDEARRRRGRCARHDQDAGAVGRVRLGRIDVIGEGCVV